MTRQKENCIVEIIIAALALFMAAFIYLKFGYYLFNDDIVMRNIVSGYYTGTPDSHAIFVMYPISFLLKLLYSVTVNIPWYGLLMVLLNTMCLYLVTRRVASFFDGIVKRLIASVSTICLFVLVYFEHLVVLDFTAEAGLLASTAVFLIATRKEHRISESIVIVLLMTFSMWYRQGAFYMSLPFALLGYLLSSYKYINFKAIKDTLKKLLPYFAELFVILVILFASDAIHKAAYSPEEWVEFRRYNSARASVFDYEWSLSYEDYVALSENPLSEPEFLGITNRAYTLFDNVPKEKLSEIYTLGSAAKASWNQYISVPRKTIINASENILKSFSTVIGLLTLVVFLLSFAACIRAQKKLETFVCLSTFLGYYLVYCYFELRDRLISRASDALALTAIALFVSVLLLVKEARHEDRLTIAYKAMFILFLLCTFGLFERREMLETTRFYSESSEYWRIINSEISNAEDELILVDNSLLPMYMPALKQQEYYAANQLWLNCWLINSPIYKDQKKLLNVSSVMDRLIEDKKCSIISMSGVDFTWLNGISAEGTLKCSDWKVPGTQIININ